jgi:hypothetical protein
MDTGRTIARSKLIDYLRLIAALAAAAVGMLVWIPVLAGWVVLDLARERLSSVHET